MVDLVSPDREVTRPPLETEDLKVPSSVRLTETGRRLETIIRRLGSSDDILFFFGGGFSGTSVIVEETAGMGSTLDTAVP